MRQRLSTASQCGIWATLAVAVLLAGQAGARPVLAAQTVILATTTSAEDSGLLKVLVPLFEQQTGYTVKTLAVGSGRALEVAAKGEADVCLVYAPESEQQYVADGLLVNRRLVMHNDFLIVGPAEDPARIHGLHRAVAALTRIATSHSLFVSRGDNSGTAQLEQKLWKAATRTPRGEWYLPVRQGMAATLAIASAKRAYTLTDRGTYLAIRRRVHLEPLVKKDPVLLNLYHVLEVNADTFPQVNAAGGKAFADFLVAKETQEIIRTFGVEKFGRPLFFADAGKREEALSETESRAPRKWSSSRTRARERKPSP